MSENKTTCACAGAPKLIFACSGAADVGAIADQAARKMTKDGAGRMFCMAGIGGRVPGIMATTQSAAKILAIDGCPLNCVKNSLELRFQEIRASAVGGSGHGERQDTPHARGDCKGGSGRRGKTCLLSEVEYDK